MHSQTLAYLTVAASLTAPGCLDPEVGLEQETAARRLSCPAWRCGFNAADVNGRSLQELNLDGLPGTTGARLIGFTPPLLRLGYVLDVQDDELVFRKGSSVLRGDQIVGAILLVQLPIGLPVPVTITRHEQVPSWAEGRPPISAYTLTYPEPLELLGLKNVCSGSLLDPLASVATVLGGERYDEGSKTVVPGQPRWFTIACAGSAAAKMKLLGYGPQTSTTTAAQRQATLKMITADYCGDGESYTENGTALHWANQD
ncbi:MAG: ADYC domain-containing protein, partial [Gemmatimonadota bacterium]|nr:ADYC domain-containing protein [Gemmatimonadota bacterium]